MRDRRVLSAVAAVLGMVLMVGCGTAPGGSQPATGPQQPAAQQQQPADRPVAEPVELSIPKIGVRSSLIALGLNKDQTVQVPPVNTPEQAGWFTGAPKPGEPGPSVILGHVNGGGHPGVFVRLRELAAGDEVDVKRTDGSTGRFVVRRAVLVPKADFPTDDVYGDTAGPELRLITCGGSFDKTAHSYRDQVIVFAAKAA
jgi:sortase (surface protein transpeptidase)